MPTFLVIIRTAKASHFTISKLLPCTLFLASTGLFLLCFDTTSLHLDLMENEYYSKLGTYLDLVIQTIEVASVIELSEASGRVAAGLFMTEG